MPHEWLSGEQVGRYGRFVADPTPEELERFFFLDEAALAEVLTRRGLHNKLGWSVQWGTVRMLGTFLTDSGPVQVPEVVIRYAAEQVGVREWTAVRQYGDRPQTPYDHAARIRDLLGYREFSAAEGSWPGSRPDAETRYPNGRSRYGGGNCFGAGRLWWASWPGSWPGSRSGCWSGKRPGWRCRPRWSGWWPGSGPGSWPGLGLGSSPEYPSQELTTPVPLVHFPHGAAIKRSGAGSGSWSGLGSGSSGSWPGSGPGSGPGVPCQINRPGPLPLFFRGSPDCRAMWRLSALEEPLQQVSVSVVLVIVADQEPGQRGTGLMRYTCCGSGGKSIMALPGWSVKMSHLCWF